MPHIGCDRSETNTLRENTEHHAFLHSHIRLLKSSSTPFHAF